MSNAAVRMDRMYRWQRHIYDITRKPYLLGRDRLIASLGVPVGGSVLEIGCGTGRNLIQAARLFPNAQYYGFDVSSVMLGKAEQSIRSAGLKHAITVAQGDATAFDAKAMFGRSQFDRVFVSYTLSMIPDWRATLEGAARCLAPGGALLIADFHDCRHVPAPLRAMVFRWLDLFGVHPRLELAAVLEQLSVTHGLKLEFQRLYGGYAVWAMLRKAHNHNAVRSTFGNGPEFPARQV